MIGMKGASRLFPLSQNILNNFTVKALIKDSHSFPRRYLCCNRLYPDIKEFCVFSIVLEQKPPIIPSSWQVLNNCQRSCFCKRFSS